jgi:hypothetical protein
MVAAMRVIFGILILFMLCGETLAGNYCADPESADNAPLPHAGEAFAPSSFKGISLASTPADLRAIARQRGFLTGTFPFVGETVVAAVNLCRDGGVVARQTSIGGAACCGCTRLRRGRSASGCELALDLPKD